MFYELLLILTTWAIYALFGTHVMTVVDDDNVVDRDKDHIIYGFDVSN